MISRVDSNKIIRSVCYFTDQPGDAIVNRLNEIAVRLSEKGYEIQSKRLCSSGKEIRELESQISDKSILLSVGTLTLDELIRQLDAFYSSENFFPNVELSSEKIEEKHAKLLFGMIKDKPERTFQFAYVFNNPPSSPFFPSASFETNGFSLGLQSTDLSQGCQSLEEWLEKMREVWLELGELFKEEQDFLGIDSSVAPLLGEEGSFVGFIKRLGQDFSRSMTTDTYLKITKFIKENNPKPVGLCGLMFPCLEDFELAKEYEAGNFSIERNIFLSLHSGLGVDTYPIGIDESPAKVLEVLKLVQGLSNKYQKPLSVRLVSDGKTQIGEKSDFRNQYLRDVMIRKL